MSSNPFSALEQLTSKSNSEAIAIAAWATLCRPAQTVFRSGGRAEEDMLAIGLDSACSRACETGDTSSLEVAARNAESPSLRDQLKKFAELSPEMANADVNSDRLQRDIIAPIAAARASIAWRSRDTAAAQEHLCTLHSAIADQSADRRPSFSEIDAGADQRLDDVLRSLAGPGNVGAMRDLVAGISAPSTFRSPLRELAVMVPSIIKGQGAFSTLRLQLVPNGTGEVYPDPLRLRLMPASKEFFQAVSDAALAATSKTAAQLRDDQDIRWYLETESKVLSGRSIGLAFALGMYELLVGVGGTATWTASAEVTKNGHLQPVGDVPTKVERILTQGSNLEAIILHPSNGDEVTKKLSASNRHSVLRMARTLQEAIRCLPNSRRRRRRFQIIGAVLVIILVVAATLAIAMQRRGAPVTEMTDEQVASKSQPSDLESRAVPPPTSVDSSPLHKPDQRTVFSVKIADSLTDEEYGVFYGEGEEITAGHQFAKMWVSPDKDHHVVFYNVKAEKSYVGVWVYLGNADWSDFIKSDLVVRCRRLPPLPEPTLYDNDGSEIPKTACTTQIKIELKLNIIDVDGELLKEGRLRKLAIDSTEEFVEVRVPLREFGRLSGRMEGKQGQPVGVNQVAIVFEHRNVERNVTGFFGLESIYLASSPVEK